MKFPLASILFLVITTLIACKAQESGENSMFFDKKEAQLEEAINEDNAGAVKAAIAQGANFNAVGLHGVTPIIVTTGNLKFNAMKALIESGSNPNTYDENGDNAVTLAATTHKKDKRYLEYLLNHGGDVNSKLPNKNPLFTRIAITHDLDAIRWIISKGANINAISRTERPLVYYYAGSGDWDTAWVLMEAGAKFNFTDPRFSWIKRLRKPTQTPPGSPLFEYKEKVWRRLCESGIEVPPLTSLKMWQDAYYPKDLPAPADQMPIISCDKGTKKVKGEWGKLKPKVESAAEYLKRIGQK